MNERITKRRNQRGASHWYEVYQPTAPHLNRVMIVRDQGI
jgi:hypothetical protein